MSMCHLTLTVYLRRLGLDSSICSMLYTTRTLPDARASVMPAAAPAVTYENMIARMRI